MTPEQEKAERLAFEADWRERNGNTFYCESVWRGWKAGRAALLAERDALRRDLARAEDSTRGFVADIENLNKQVRELRAFQAMVNRHRPEFPADPDGIRDVWYWQGDGEDRLESMVHQLPVVIRAEQLRELLAEQAKPSPAGWRFNRIGEREIEIHCPTFTTPLVVSLDVSDRRLLAFYNLAADLVDAQPQPKKTEFPEPHFVDQATGDSAYSADQMHAFAAKRFADGVALGVEQMTVDLDAAQAEVARLKAQAPAPAPTPGPAAVTALVADAKKAVEELTELALNNEAYSIADYQRESRKHGEAFEFALNNLATFATQVQATPAPAVGDAE